MSGRRPALYEEIGALDVAAVAAALGLTPGRGGSWGPCPCCGAEHRGSDDRRGPLGARGGGWRCHRCKARGDGAALVAAVATGAPKPADASGWAVAREVAERAGLVAPSGDAGGSVGRSTALRRVSVPPKPPAAPVARERAAERVEEARALWAAAWSPAIHDDTRRWCIARGWGELGALRLGQLGMLGGAAPEHDYPAWARFKRGEGASWYAAGWRALTPLYDARGDLVDVRARWVGVELEADDWRTVKPPFAAKSLAGRGAIVAGTVWAPCPVARALLAVGAGAVPGELAPGVVWDGRVWLTEGDVDAFTVAAALARSRPPAHGWPAVLGYAQGSFTAALAARIPARARVTIYPDNDASTGREVGAGRKMAAAVWAHLSAAGDGDVRARTIAGGGDLNDAFTAGLVTIEAMEEADPPPEPWETA